MDFGPLIVYNDQLQICSIRKIDPQLVELEEACLRTPSAPTYHVLAEYLACRAMRSQPRSLIHHPDAPKITYLYSTAAQLADDEVSQSFLKLKSARWNSDIIMAIEDLKSAVNVFQRPFTRAEYPSQFFQCHAELQRIYERARDLKSAAYHYWLSKGGDESDTPSFSRSWILHVLCIVFAIILAPWIVLIVTLLTCFVFLVVVTCFFSIRVLRYFCV